MVLTWNPETDATEVGININDMIHQNQTPPEGIAKVKHSFRPSMGNTNGVAFTETAPLVFPALDKLDGNDSAEYFDRRAQAKFAAEAPDSQLVVGPKPTFTSRYADPNNASNSGDMLALLTAGKLSMPQRGGFGGGMGGRGFGGLGVFGAQSGYGMRGGFGMGSPYDQRMGYDAGYGRRGMVGYGGRGQMGYDQQYPPNEMNQQYPNQQYPAQQYQNRQYSNQQYPNQQYPQQQYQNQGPMQVGFGGPQLIANGVKRILRHVNSPASIILCLSSHTNQQ
jgi:hypothetical protein